MQIRDLFPFFAQHESLIYADSAATSQKPLTVINAVTDYLSHDCATVHRSGYKLATAATHQYEQSRQCVSKLINSGDSRSIVFTKGATEALNVIASGLSDSDILMGEEILVCGSEHHANLLPWQRLAEQTGRTLRIMPMTKTGCLRLDTALQMISDKTAIVAIAHVSNVLGNCYPIELFIEKAKQHNALSVIDGTQAIPHINVDVVELDCDFYVFSGHKMYAPTGTGVLYGRYPLLERLSVYQLGGDMVNHATYHKADYQQPPLKFEAGTPNILGVIGLGEAARFVTENAVLIQQTEKALATALHNELNSIDNISLLGDFATGKSTIPIASFTPIDFHAHDLALLLDKSGVAIRHGQHCAMPLMQTLGIDGTLRISLAAYNTLAEISLLGSILRDCIKRLLPSNLQVTNAADRSEEIIHSELPLAAKIKASQSWDDMFRQIMLAGKTLNILPIEQRTDRHFISGCEAQVWLSGDVDQFNQAGVFFAYSPSKIVRGLLAILLEKTHSLPARQLQREYDYQNYLSTIGLARFLSESRRNGLNAVIDVIKAA